MKNISKTQTLENPQVQKIILAKMCDNDGYDRWIC